MCAHILVAEDDDMQAKLIHRLLLQEGHTAVVVHDGRAAIDEAKSRTPDLVVLDLMLPKVDGLGVCRVLRQDGDIPVLMLTARSTEDDMLLGLELGADDYMTKPYSPRELLARIRTVLRRTLRPAEDSPVLRAGGITVDPARHKVTCDGSEVPCTPGEFAILHAMTAEPDRVFSRRQLLQLTRGHERASTERAIDVHVMNLRKKIEPDPRRPVRLLTVFGVGYKLTGQPT
ncbi:response regulator transcription factor [Streptomyces jeddahensis]|nr:response regulator transcription factor [Streptomyces jeddahensis]